MKYLYGFLSYKEPISDQKMKQFQLFIAKFVNKASGHNVGEFKEEEPIFTRNAEKSAYILKRKFVQIYKNMGFSGAYEIITRRDGNVTNSYFIGHSSEGAPPSFYSKFRNWALQ
jgi:hypothetical protein